MSPLTAAGQGLAVSAVRIESSPLGGGALSRLAQSGQAPAEWYPRRPRTPDEWRHRVEQVRAGAGAGWHRALAAGLGDPSGAAAERIARVAEGQGVVVTSGQQPGLFGGPVYTWSKAVSALALADTIESETGIPAAPVFWAATDDGDFTEASFTMVSRPGGADRISIASTRPDGTRLSAVPLPDMTEAIERLATACGSQADARPLQCTRDAYGRPSTVGGAYVSLLRALLEPLGIVVLDASHDAVARAAHPTLLRALHERESVARALVRRSADLAAAGFPPQVRDVESLTLVFERQGDRRERIPRARGAVAAATAAPGALSPNVLLRPVVERALLPTVAYVAGPGELAYFAQVSAVAAALHLDAPMAVPRWSGTLIEPHIAELMQRLGVTTDDFADPHAAEVRFAREAWPAGVSAAMEQLRRDLAARLGGLRSSLQALDGATPAPSVDGAARAIEWRLQRLERRITAAVKARETALLQALATIRGSLYPGGVRQERALNLIPLLARHGMGLLDEMRASASGHARSIVSATEPAVAT